jgi:hypothetical protein
MSTLVPIARCALAALLLLSACSHSDGSPAPQLRRVFHVHDFGAQADHPADSGAAVRRAIEAAIASGPGAEVVLGEGTYRVEPRSPRQAVVPIGNATNLVVRGAGPATRILVTDPEAGGFSFSLCRQVILRNLVIDYDPLPFCQGTIRGIDVVEGSFDLEIAEGYPTPDGANFQTAIDAFGKWGMIMDPATRRIRQGTPDHYMTPRWEHRGGAVWRFVTANEYHRRNLQHMRVGDAYVHLARGHGSAVFAQACDGILIENVTVHAAPGPAVVLVGNAGEITVRGLQVRFAPASSRLLTTNADGVHCQQNRSGPTIEDCTFEGMADDAINIYTPPNVLHAVESPTQWVVSAGAGVQPGDRLQVLDPITGRFRGQVAVLAVRGYARNLRLMLAQPLDGVVPGADHRTADTLYNLDASGAGFQIRRNHMRGHRRYGCLLRAGSGIIEDNIFEDTTGAGVVLTNEPDWPEGPVPFDITIRRNRFIRGGTCLGYADSADGAALVVRAARLGHAMADAESIRNVRIESNQFHNPLGTGVFVGGAAEVVLRGNRFIAEPGAERVRAGAVMVLQRSSNVVLVDNSVSDPRPLTTAAVQIGQQVAPGDGGVHLSGLQARLAPGSREVVDQRTGAD